MRGGKVGREGPDDGGGGEGMTRREEKECESKRVIGREGEELREAKNQTERNEWAKGGAR